MLRGMDYQIEMINMITLLVVTSTSLLFDSRELMHCWIL